jgi:hypothetical protein
LGDNECSGFELGLSVPQIKSLQQVAYDQLVVNFPVKAAPLQNLETEQPQRCQR